MSLVLYYAGFFPERIRSTLRHGLPAGTLLFRSYGDALERGLAGIAEVVLEEETLDLSQDPVKAPADIPNASFAKVIIFARMVHLDRPKLRALAGPAPPLRHSLHPLGSSGPELPEDGRT